MKLYSGVCNINALKKSFKLRDKKLVFKDQLSKNYLFLLKEILNSNFLMYFHWNYLKDSIIIMVKLMNISRIIRIKMLGICMLLLI